MTTATTLEIVATGAALGAQVLGIDLSKPIDEAIREQLRAAKAEHLVLLFRDQNMSDQNILEFCEVFGGLQIPAARRYWQAKGNKIGEFGVPQIAEISAINNLDENGKPTQDNDDLGSCEVVWHSDNS